MAGANGTGVIDLDALIAQPQRVRLGGREFDLKPLTTEQYLMAIRGANAMREAASGATEGNADSISTVIDLLDGIFPEVGGFRTIAPSQLIRIIEIIIGLQLSGNAESPAGEEPSRAESANSTD